MHQFQFDKIFQLGILKDIFQSEYEMKPVHRFKQFLLSVVWNGVQRESCSPHELFMWRSLFEQKELTRT